VAGAERNVSIIIKARNEAGKTLGTIGQNLTSLAGIATATAATVAAIGVAFTKITQAAAEQERADVRLGMALASIGQNTAAVRGHLAQFIASLEDVSTVSDETISGVVATFAQLGQLSGQSLEQATRAALDYAAATGQDVQTAAIQMVNVLVKGSGRLQGIATDFDAATVKGNRFASVIEQIESKMGGAASVTGRTFSGALQRIANDLDNLEQATGKAIVENEAFRGLLEAVSTTLKGATEFVASHSEALDLMTTAAGHLGLVLIRTAAQIVSYQAEIVRANILVAEHYVALAELAATVPALSQKVFGVGGELAGELALKIAKVIGVLGKVREGFEQLGSGGEHAAQQIQAIIDALGKGGGKTEVASTIQNIGKTASAAASSIQGLSAECSAAAVGIDQLGQVLNELGIPGLEQFNEQSRAVDDALRMLVDLQAQGLISPEQWDAILGAITGITQELPQWTENFSAAVPHVENLNEQLKEMHDNIAGALTDSVFQFGDALIDTAFGAKIAWGQFLRQMLADLLKAVIRAALLKSLFAAIGLAFGGAPASAGGGGGGISIGGGLVAEAASAIGSPAQLISPAVPFDAGGAAGAAAASAGIALPLRPEFSLRATIVPRRDRTSEAIEILEQINSLVERRGYRLVASQVTA
jgi:hypothetical protein